MKKIAIALGLKAAATEQECLEAISKLTSTSNKNKPTEELKKIGMDALDKTKLNTVHVTGCGTVFGTSEDAETHAKKNGLTVFTVTNLSADAGDEDLETAPAV